MWSAAAPVAALFSLLGNLQMGLHASRC